MRTPGPHAHGIGNEELLAGPAFDEAIARMVAFVHGLVLSYVQSCSTSDDGDNPELPRHGRRTMTDATACRALFLRIGDLLAAHPVDRSWTHLLESCRV